MKTESVTLKSESIAHSESTSDELKDSNFPKKYVTVVDQIRVKSGCMEHILSKFEKLKARHTNCPDSSFHLMIGNDRVEGISCSYRVRNSNYDMEVAEYNRIKINGSRYIF